MGCWLLLLFHYSIRWDSRCLHCCVRCIELFDCSLRWEVEDCIMVSDMSRSLTPVSGGAVGACIVVSDILSAMEAIHPLHEKSR